MGVPPRAVPANELLNLFDQGVERARAIQRARAEQEAERQHRYEALGRDVRALMNDDA
jgi:hypothetical protein